MTVVTTSRESKTRFQGEAAGVFLDQKRLEQEAVAGYWPNRVLTDYLDDSVRVCPDAVAILARRTETGSENSLSYSELDNKVNRIAANLMRLNVNAGDVVSFQLPNWWEFVAIHLACVRIGAVSNPLMTIFRSRELKFMIGRAQSKVLIVPGKFRNFDHEGLARELQRDLPDLEHIVVIGGEGNDSFEDILLGEYGDTFAPGETLMQPNDIMKLMYTSGTTGEPKGVMHTSNTLLASVAAMTKRLDLDRNDVLFMPSPFAHSIGFVYGIMMSVYLGTPLITMDVWDPEEAVVLMERYAITFTSGATPFMSDLANVPGVRKRNLDNFRLFLTGGAPVPPALVTQTSTRLKAKVIVGFGMTEFGFVSTTIPAQEAEGSETDGVPLPCCEARVVGPDQVELPGGEEGNLQCRGSTTFTGYYKRPDLYAVDEEGWFDTGDLALMNEQGYIRIVGRDKDIIIRGGENIPVIEVEKLIYEMPAVSDVALVAMPDPRLGEKGCAFVTLHDGQNLCLQELVEFLQSKELARIYMPERLEVLEALPRTPAGKIQKFVLREMAREFT